MGIFEFINAINPTKENFLNVKSLSPTFQTILLNMLATDFRDKDVILCDAKDEGWDCVLTFKINNESKKITVDGDTSINNIRNKILHFLS